MPPGHAAGLLPHAMEEPEELEEAPPGEAPIPDDVDGLIAEVVACHDSLRMGRLAAVAGRELAPQDLVRLYQVVEGLAGRARVRAFRQRAPLYARLLRQEAPVFTSRSLSSHARLYEAAGVPRAEKSLLVLFTGLVGGTFVPVVRLLVQLPAGAFDVLRLHAGPARDYPSGVPGLGDSLCAVARAIRDLAAGYVGGAALGTSLGGYSALRAAVLAQLPVAVSIGGRFTKLARLERPRDQAGAPRIPAFDPLCPCASPQGTTLIAYYAAENATDARHAQQLAGMRPDACIRPVAGATGHNPMPQMVGSGAFDALLVELRRLSVRRTSCHPSWWVDRC